MKLLQDRGRLVDADPALVLFPEGQGEPLPAGRRLGAPLGRMGRHEGGVRQKVLPGPSQFDQVVAVGAVTMEEDDELARRSAGARRQPRPSEFCGHHSSVDLVGLHRNGVALFDRPIIGPQQPRRHSAPRPPRLGQRDDFLRGRPRRQREGKPRGFLQGKIAGRPGIRMAKAEQQVDVGRPRPDAVDGAQRLMGGIGRHVRQRVAIERAARDGPGDLLEGADLGRRQAEPGEPVGARPDQGLRGERIVGGGEPSPDRAGARGRKLLGHHDAGDSRKAAGAAPQRQGSGDGRHLGKPGIGREQRAKAGGDIGFGVDAAGHAGSASGLAWEQEIAKIAIDR